MCCDGAAEQLHEASCVSLVANRQRFEKLEAPVHQHQPATPSGVFRCIQELVALLCAAGWKDILET